MTMRAMGTGMAWVTYFQAISDRMILARAGHDQFVAAAYGVETVAETESEAKAQLLYFVRDRVRELVRQDCERRGVFLGTIDGNGDVVELTIESPSETFRPKQVWLKEGRP